MVCVVTGGMGFIGSNLAEHLARDNEVAIIDDGATGWYINPKQLRKRSLGSSNP